MTAFLSRFAPPRWLTRLALADLRTRPLPVVLTVGSVALALAVFLLFGSIGARVYESQAAAVRDAGLTEIEVELPPAAPGERLIDAPTLAAWNRLDGVRAAAGKVQLRVRTSAGGRRGGDLLAEGTFPDDPRATGGRLAAGRTVSGPDAAEVVLSRAAFEKLGGTWDGAAFRPDSITVEVARVYDGAPQTQSVAVAVVGLLARERDAQMYLPADLIRRLDLWCEGRIEGAASGAAAGPGYPAVVAFGPTAGAPQLAAELAPFGLRGVVGPELPVFVPDDPEGAGRRGLREYLTDPSWLVARRWHTYRIEPAVAGKTIPAGVVTALNMAHPTLAVALPDVSVRASVGGEVVRLIGSAAHDPRRFAAGLTGGGWVAADPAAPGVVLPAAVAEAALPTDAPSDRIGRTVTLEVAPDGATGDGGPLTLRVRVAGVTAGGDGFAPVGLVERVRRWQQGKAVFDRDRNEFTTPLDLAERRGLPRATVFAATPEAVPGVVERLRADGFVCRDQLGHQQALRELGRVLVGLITAFAGGFLLCAALAVYTTAALTVEGKRGEIGLLKAHGLTAREILGVYALQGVVMAALACAAGGLVAGLLEPPAVALLRSAFRLPPEVFAGSLGSAPWWLFASAVGLAAGVGVAGAVHPAARAIRSTAVEAMR